MPACCAGCCAPIGPPEVMPCTTGPGRAPGGAGLLLLSASKPLASASAASNSGNRGVIALACAARSSA
eukprot:5203308-Prymnesium_polylepis.1